MGLRKEEKVRKDDKSRKEERLNHKEKRRSQDKEKRRRSDDHAKTKSHESTEVAKPPESKEKQRRLSGSEHSDSAMPELEPQVATGSPMQSTPKKPSRNSSKDPL